MTVNSSTYVAITLNVQTASAERTNFGALCIITDHTVTANRQDGPYTTLAEAEAAGFTSSADPFTYTALTAAFAQENGVQSVIVGREDSGDADWTATINAVIADDPDSFYFLAIESRLDADIQDVYTVIETTGSSGYPKLFMAQTDDKTMTECLVAQAAGINRTAFVYNASDSQALDAAFLSKGGGKNLDISAGQSGWTYMPLSGATPAVLTTAEATAILAAGANYYDRQKGLSFTYNGKVASGREIRTQVTLDWLTDRLGAAYFETVVGGNIDISSDADIGKIAAAIQEVLNQGVTYGHLTADRNGPPTLTVPKAEDISDADYAAGNLPITGQVTVAKSLQKLTLAISVQLT